MKNKKFVSRSIAWLLTGALILPGMSPYTTAAAVVEDSLEETELLEDDANLLSDDEELLDEDTEVDSEEDTEEDLDETLEEQPGGEEPSAGYYEEGETDNSSEEAGVQVLNADEASYLAYYPLKEDANDASENGQNAQLKGSGANFDNGYLQLPGGSAGSSAAYVQLPTGMFDNKEAVSVSVWLKNETGSGNYAGMFFGTTESLPVGYWLLNPANPDGYYKSVVTNSRNTGAPYNTEYGFSATNSANGIVGPKTDNGWHMYTTVIKSGTSIEAYYDDEYLGSVDIDAKISDWGSNLVSYIGKSSYNDPFYKGGVKEVKVYDGAIDQAQVTENYQSEILNMALAELDLGDTSAVKTDLTLPTALNNGVTVSWASDREDVITADGKVTRQDTDTQVKLTATLDLNGQQVTKEFTVTVSAKDVTADLNDAKEALNMLSVTSEDLKLPAEGILNSKITWKSSDTDVMTDDGKIVNRPAVGEGNAKVTLTATITIGSQSVTKDFPVEVMEEFYGYIYGYITGDNDREGSLHLATSLDGKAFEALNGNAGVLYAQIPTGDGTKNLSTGIRFNSVYLFRQADGSFGVVAPQGKDKKSVYLYDSEDLLTYTNSRLLKTNTAVGDLSEAECTYDTLIGAYRVNWTSGEKQYSNISSDLETLQAASEYEYTAFENEADSIPENAKKGNYIGVTKAEYEKIVNRFAVVEYTGTVAPAAVTVANESELEEALPDHVVTQYSDGSESSMNVEWDLSSADTSEAGTYTLKGTLSTYSNPLIEQRADPYIVWDEDSGYYYFTASYPAYNTVTNGYDRLVLRRAETIQGLSDAEEITIWKAPSSGKMARHVWAPELHKINGTWYMFFAAGNSDNVWAIRPYVLVCQNSEDPFNPDSWVNGSGEAEIHAATSQESAYFKNMSLDMTYFEHNGHHYVIWADIIGQSALYMQEIDPDQPWVGQGKVILLTTPEYGWERDTERVNEGATIIKHDGKIFCAFSASGTGPEYCIGMLYADEDADLMDPASWTKMNYPLLTSSDVPGEYGPGHNCFTVDSEGNPVFVYHARSEECYNNQCDWANSNSLYDPCRHARVKNVHWNEEGLPILKMSAEEELPEEAKNVTIQVTIEESAVRDLADAMIAEIPEYTETGSQIKPEIKVSYHGADLTEGKDYEVSYGENTEPGTGTVTITAVDGSNYKGSQTAEFVISKKVNEILHYDMTVEDGKLVDSSDSGLDGNLKSLTEDNLNTYNGVSTLNLDGNGYVELPKGLVTDETMTVSVTAATTKANNQWLFTLGQDSWNYSFFTPTNGSKNTKLAIAQQEPYNSTGAWAKEQTVQTTSKATAGNYQTYTAVYNGDKMYLYVNGVLAGESAKSFNLTDIVGDGDIQGYIGKSLYSSDPLYVGSVAQVTVYDGAMTAAQVEAQAESVDYAGYIAADVYAAMLNGNDPDAVEASLNFPASVDGVDLTWSVEEGQDVIGEDGKIKPAEEDTTVDVTVSYTWNGEPVEETYELTVKGVPAEEIADQLEEALTLPYSTEEGKEVYGNITLPETVTNGYAEAAVTWTTDHPEIVDVEAHENEGAYADDPTPAGLVTRPEKDTVVTMTAEIKVNDEITRIKEFTFTVKAAPEEIQESDYTDYFFAYFIGEGYSTGEQIYFGSSRDGLHWEELNNGDPYLTSTLGDKGVRDPFIMRSAEGDKFYLIATDLKINGGAGWTAAQTAGSQCLMVWESTDLVNWGEQRMVEVSAEIEAGCTWAPEATYDPQTGEYVVYWASKVPDDNYGKQRIYYAKTRDFYTFTEPQLFIENSFSTIDTTIYYENDTYYRFSKNEDNGAKYTVSDKTSTLLHSEATVIDSPSLKAQHGEGPTIFKFNEDDVETNGYQYCLLVDDNGGVGYFPMVTNDLESGEWTRLSTDKYQLPSRPRHGTPIRITAEEYEKVEGAMSSEGLNFQNQTTEVTAEAAEDNTVTVSWKAVDNAKSYGVYRKAENGEFEQIAVVGSDVTSYTDEKAADLEAGTYYYTVKGFWGADGTGASTKYPTDVTVTLGNKAQDDFQNITTEVTASVNEDNQAVVEWKAVENAKSYGIYRRAAEEDSFKGIAVVGSDVTSYVDETAQAGETYYYTVKGFWEEDAQGVSTKYPVNVKVTIPDNEEDLQAAFQKVMPEVTAKADGSSVVVEWEAIEHAGSYRIYRKEAGGSFKGLATVSADKTSYVDETAQAGVTYYYTVKGFWEEDAAGVATQYPTDVEVYLPIAEADFAKVMPQVSAKAGKDSITVSWEEIKEAKSYRIYRKEAGGSFKGLTNAAAGTTSMTDTTAKPGVTYYYTVKAFWEEDAQGTCTQYPTDVTAKIAVDALATPAVKTRSVNYCTVEVSWNKVTGADKYVIYRKEAKAGTSFKSIGTVGEGTLSYRDGSAQMGVNYYYTVKAYAGSISSDYQKTVTGMAVPSAPTLKAAGSSKGVTITWTGSKAGDLAFADGYRVFRKTAGGSWKTVGTVGANTRSFTDTTGAKGTTYYYTVRAYVKQSDGTNLWGTYNTTGVAGAKK